MAEQPGTIDDLIRSRARESGCDEPIIAYPDDETDYIDYTPRQLDQLVEAAALAYIADIPQRQSSDEVPSVIGLLGDSNLDYLVTLLAISRLGHSVLLLSTRITDEGYESLLSRTQAVTLLCQDQFLDTSQRLQAAFPHLKTSRIRNVRDLDLGASLPPAHLDATKETQNISFIIHSSGSTGLPKPIFQTHKACLYSYSQNFGLVGFISLPLYHNHGISCLFRAISSGKKIYLYNCRLPLATRHLLATFQRNPQIEIFYGVPYALKLLSETDSGIEALSRLKIVMFGGSSCPQSVGDLLVGRGVNLVSHYGATEVGQLMTSFRDHKNDSGWDWLRVPSNLKPFLSMEPRGSDLFELCVKQGWPSKVESNREDGSYATKDLFSPHHSLPDQWKYYARLDDTIVLENGEKANPLLPEGVLRQNSNVAEAVVFGAGKPRLGAFIIPSSTCSLDDESLINEIMPAVEASNQEVPAFSQLSRDVIKILPKTTKYRSTDKGTVIRAAFYRDFASQIDSIFTDESSGSLVLPVPEMAELLRKSISRKLSSRRLEVLTNDTDLFSLGVDSLMAIQIRSSILDQVKVDAASISRNFVFEFPTINAIAEELVRLQSKLPTQKKSSIEERMQQMIEKYSKFEAFQGVGKEADKKCMLVTGATGSLGAHVVGALTKNSSVSKIYCLVRAEDNVAAGSRVRQSMEQRKVLDQLSLESRGKIVALRSEFSDEYLGLPKETYEEISNEMTHLLHLAWSVNFNKTLESFEMDCVAGAYHLLKLCLLSNGKHPASFNFCSSVSATVNTRSEEVAEALPDSLSCAQGMGYAQSKLVTEHICDRASRQTGIRTRVLRVGQVIGDTQYGVWNATEAIPMIFQTAKTIGALPELDESPLWLPVDVAAQSFVDIALSDADSGVMNLVNSHRFSWTADLLPLLRSAGLKFQQLPAREWVARLRHSDPNPTVNPPIKLVDFFASKYDNDRPRRDLDYETQNARAYSPTLSNATVIDLELVRKMIAYLSNICDAPVHRT